MRNEIWALSVVVLAVVVLFLTSYYKGVPIPAFQHSNVFAGPSLALLWLLGIGALSVFVICAITWWNSLSSGRYRGM